MTNVVPVKTYRKAAVERRRLYLDYSCWLEPVEELVDVQSTVIPYTDENPIVVTNGYPDVTHKKLVMFVAGGVGNTNYTIQILVRTDAGQIKRDDIGIVVTP
jgi:hypothetical protein